jgi:hypothetical protein
VEITPLALVPEGIRVRVTVGNGVTPIPAADGVGLLGEYFDNLDLTAPVISRLEAVDFDWGYGAPPGVAPETFSVRWTGQVMPRFTEDYVFFTTTDDGARLWVDGQLVIDRWQLHPEQDHPSGRISLQAGRKYDLKLEYYENTSKAVARLGWYSRNTPGSVIPKSQLFPPPAPDAGMPDAGAVIWVDAGVADGGAEDAGAIDAGAVDLDAGAVVGGEVDAGAVGADAGEPEPSDSPDAGQTPRSPDGNGSANTGDVENPGAAEPGPIRTGCTSTGDGAATLLVLFTGWALLARRPRPVPVRRRR